MTDLLTSREAADRLGVSVQTWHRLTAKYDVHHDRSLPGIRGAKFWRTSDVDHVAERRLADAA